MRSYVVGALGFLALTNLWVGWDEGAARLQAADIISYRDIALAFGQGDLSTLQALPSHHAQRWFMPALVGWTAGITHVPVEVVFRVFGIILVLGCAWLWSTVVPFGLFLAWIWSPYAFRYHLIVPGLIPDLLFLLGLVLFFKKGRWALPGLCLAVLGRQTGLLLLPGFIWLCLREGRKREALIGSALGLSIFTLNIWVLKDVALPSSLLGHGLGLMRWMGDFRTREFAEFMLRNMMPLLIPFGMIAGLGAWKSLVSPAGLTAALIWLQPVLGGPAVTGASATRLAGFAIVPLLFSFKEHWDEKDTNPWVLGPLILASFHHLYTWVGPATPIQSVVLYFACAGLLGVYLFSGYPGRQTR